MNFAGTYTAIITPFNDDFSLDFNALEKVINRQIKAKVSGIVLNGCTGEAPLLSLDETRELIFRASRICDNRIPLIVGTGRNTTSETISLSLLAQELGASAVMVIAPSAIKPTQSGLILHYTEVADALEIPVMIYHIPGRTCAKMTPETIAELAKHPRINALKEASAAIEIVPEVISRCNITVLSGDDPLTLPMMALGAKGVVSVTSNAAPEQVVQMVNFALTGDFEKARALHYRLLPLFKALFLETNPIPVKAAAEILGLASHRPRPPLTPAKKDTFDQVRIALSDLDQIK